MIRPVHAIRHQCGPLLPNPIHDDYIRLRPCTVIHRRFDDRSRPKYRFNGRTRMGKR